MGNITSVNDVVLSYGYKKEDLIGKSYLEFVPFVSEKHRSIFDKYVASITSGKIAQGEMEFNTPKGILTVWFRASPIEKRGEIVGFQIILIDISKRKKAEEALKQSEQKLRDVIDTSPDAIVWVDTTGKITLVNRKGFELTGFSEKALIGKNFMDVEALAPESKEKILESFMKRIEGIDTPPYEVEVVTKNGGIIPAELSASLIYEEGKIVGTQSILRDLRERKRTEERLRESEERLRVLIESAPDAIYINDLNGNFIDGNRQAEEMTGYTREELIGKNMLEIGLLPEKYLPKAVEALEKNMRGQKTGPDEFELTRKDGSTVTVEISTFPVKREEKVEVIGIARDITERKQIEEKLRESEERLRGLIEYAPDTIWVVDLNGNLIDANKQAEKMMGYTKEELIGKNMLELGLISEKYLPKTIENLEKIMSGQKIKPLELELIRKDGSTITLETSAFPVKRGEKIEVIGISRDITERKKMEEELRESEERFRTLFQSIQDPVGIFVGREGHLIEYNTAFKKMSGYTDEELKDKIFLDFVHPDDHALVLERYQTKYSEEELPLVYEIRGVNKKGEPIPLEISVSTYKKRGRIIGIEVIHRDITERKMMEEQLKESEERLRDLYESVPDALAVYVGKEGHLIDYNTAFKKWTGCTDEELKDKIFLDFVHPDYHAMLLEEYRIKRSEEELPFVCEINGISKKGELIPTEISVGPYRKKGRIIGINVMHRNISERRKAEEALRRSEGQARRLLEFQNKVIDTADVWINLLDTEGNVILWNRAAELISKYSREEVVGHRKIWEWLYPDPKYRAEIFAQAKKIIEKEGHMENDETIIRCKDGTLKTIRWYDNSIMDERGKPAGSIAIGMDITEKKEMERKLQEYAEHLEDMVEERTKELRESQERLIKAERMAAIGQLATMVGHDLRNPLAAIQNASYYVKMKMETSKDEKLKKMLRIIDKEIDYSNKIIKDLLNFSRVKKPEFKKVDIISSIQDAVAQLKFPENITLTTKFSKVPPMEADPDQLRRVFQNIALNGIQAMPNRGKLTVSARKNGDFIEVAFTDTGVGISEENMDKIFTPLFTTKAQGVGLGLAICKNLVESHNGRIEVKSKVGEGTTFTVKLPVHQSKGGEK